MAIGPVDGKILTEIGLRGEFMDTYVTGMANRAQLAKVMRVDLPTDRRVTPFAVAEATPGLERWDIGTQIPEATLKFLRDEVALERFGIKLTLVKEDIEDDQTGTVLNVVRKAATTVPNAYEQIVLRQYLGGQNLPRFLRRVTNCLDGVPMFSPLNGAGGNRFGLLGGNIEPGLGITPAAILQTILNVHQRFGRFQNNLGDPQNDPAQIQQLTLICGYHLYSAVLQALYQTRPVQVSALTTAGVGGTSQGVSNPSNAVIDLGQGIGLSVTPWPSTYLDNTNDLFFCATSLPKSLFSLLRTGLEEWLEDLTNSDRARDLRRVGMQWSLRVGFKCMLPFDWIGVDNSPSGIGS